MNDIAKSKFGTGGLQYTVQDKNIKPLGSRVLVSKMNFGEKQTKGGIILLDDDGKESGIHPRWCQVYATGPKQEDVHIGQWLLVSHGRWSRALKVVNNGVSEEVRMIDENDILLVSDEEPNLNETSKKAGYVNTGGMEQMTSLPGND
jgi:co-chaperonin GroES (HSP10)